MIQAESSVGIDSPITTMMDTIWTIKVSCAEEVSLVEQNLSLFNYYTILGVYRITNTKARNKYLNNTIKNN